MIKSKVQANLLAQDFVPGRRQTKTAVVYIFCLVAFGGDAKAQRRALARFHFERYFAAPRTGCDGAAERIEKAFRGADIATAQGRTEEGQRLGQSYLVSIAVVLFLGSTDRKSTRLNSSHGALA